ncbi:hypothetical protein [Actinocrispum wychmicini]|uniref:Flp pilus-assembly TadE/G-like protein n=1 Tax=Actinocrispum wychmicini TaxID=1213861 RepID=A0A4R2IWN3_9PSEU|nr:hypothetical protein [Actinocrispum wychmicini]TCO49647.1 hypothetical protein EV192_11412 [Actinocrispum wychmicini]
MVEPSDRGSLSVFVAAVLGVMMLVFAFVIDLHGQTQAIARADALAAEGARAALTAVDTRGSVIGIDTGAAVAAAQSYLAYAGATGSVHVTAPRTIHVTVTVDQPAVIGLLGAWYHAVGDATAELKADTRDSTP